MSDDIRRQVEEAFQWHRERNDRRSFEREFMGELPSPSPDYLQAYRRWEQYHAECDAYDRQYENLDGILPDYARGLVNRNSIEAHRRASEELYHAGIDPDVIRNARRDVANERGRRESREEREKGRRTNGR